MTGVRRKGPSRPAAIRASTPPSVSKQQGTSKTKRAKADAFDPVANAPKKARSTAALPTFLSIGAGITGSSLLAMAVAKGRRAIGVELREAITLPPSFNTREELLTEATKIDHLMNERYPGRQTMRLADELKKVLIPVVAIEDVDARGPVEKRTSSPLVKLKDPDPTRKLTDYDAMLSSGTPWQVHATELQTVYRNYLEHLEASDRSAGIDPPRLTLHVGFRPVQPVGVDGKPLSSEAIAALPPEERGLWKDEHGKLNVSIEAVERNPAGGMQRKAGTKPLSLGAADLTAIAEGTNSSSATRLGHAPKDVVYSDLSGSVGVETVARKRVFSGRLGIPVGPVLRNRIDEVHDENGKPYWLRQQLVGGKKEHGAWVLVEVPEHQSFDPLAAGKVPVGTAPTSLEYRSAQAVLMKSFYLEQAALVLDTTPETLRDVPLTFGPNLFTLTKRESTDVVVASNAVITGDRVATGFFGYGGAMTGAISHTEALASYFDAVDAGADVPSALQDLSSELIAGSKAWVRLSKAQFEGPDPKSLKGAPGALALPTISSIEFAAA